MERRDGQRRSSLHDLIRKRQNNLLLDTIKELLQASNLAACSSGRDSMHSVHSTKRLFNSLINILGKTHHPFDGSCLRFCALDVLSSKIYSAQAHAPLKTLDHNSFIAQLVNFELCEMYDIVILHGCDLIVDNGILSESVNILHNTAAFMGSVLINLRCLRGPDTLRQICASQSQILDIHAQEFTPYLFDYQRDPAWGSI